MEMQEIYNAVAKHLLTQNEKSYDENVGCRYRTVRDGRTLKCGIGGIMPDDLYYEYFEGKSAVGVLYPTDPLTRDDVKFQDKSAKLRELWGFVESDFIGSYSMKAQLMQKLQGVHDNGQPQNWRVALVNVAREFGLDSSVTGLK